MSDKFQMKMARFKGTISVETREIHERINTGEFCGTYINTQKHAFFAHAQNFHVVY